MNLLLKCAIPGLMGMAMLFTGCSNSVTVKVTNELPSDRLGEMVQLNLEDVKARVGDSFRIVDSDENEVPYQITYDDKLIFPASVAANSTSSYDIVAGEPSVSDTIAVGYYYAGRQDDIAWENDKAAYRAYGPGTQNRGERVYGYDVFTKSVEYPVVDHRYKLELDPANWERPNALRKEGRHQEADSLVDLFSYHVDHGNGMDVYTVGPTLGGGASALMSDSALVYPYAYKEYEILDNGPLRFTVKMVYNPLTVGEDSAVVETRVISLDAGSYLNRTELTFDGLSKPAPIASGIVVHKQNPEGYVWNNASGFIAYADSTDNARNNNGVIYLGAVVPGGYGSARMLPMAEPVGDALGHVIAESAYNPGDKYVYYWGSGWSKGGVDSYDDWTNSLADYSARIASPLIITLE